MIDFLSNLIMYIAHSASSRISWAGLFQPEPPKELCQKQKQK